MENKNDKERILPPHLWKEGQTGNPNGRPKESKEHKALRALTKAEMLEVGNIIVQGDVDALKVIAKDPKTIVLKAMIASVAIKIIQKGDMYSLDVLLNRLIGKVKDEIDHSILGGNTQIVVTLPSNGFGVGES